MINHCVIVNFLLIPSVYAIKQYQNHSMVIGMVIHCGMATIYYFKKFLNVGFKFPLSPKENFNFFFKKKE